MIKSEDPILAFAVDTLQQDEPNVNSLEKQMGTLQIIDGLEEAADVLLEHSSMAQPHI